MKKISKIIMCIMSIAVIVFLLPLSAVAGYSFWTQTSQEDFEAGTYGSTTIDVSADGGTALKLQAQDTDAEFNAGTKSNVTVAFNQVKLTKNLQAISNQSFETGSGSSPQFNFDNWTESRYEKGNGRAYITRESFYPYSGSYSCKLRAYSLGSFKSGQSDYSDAYITQTFIYGGGNISIRYIVDRFIDDGGTNFGSIQIRDSSNQYITGMYIPEGETGWKLATFSLSDSYIGQSVIIRAHANATTPLGDQHGDIIFRCDLASHIKYQLSGDFTSQSLDYGSIPDNFGNLAGDLDVPSGTTLKFKTASSANPTSGFDTWEYIGSAGENGGMINSAPKQYLKWKGYFTSPTGGKTPIINSVYVGGAPFISQYHDCGTGISFWGNFVVSHNLNGQTIDYAVRTSSFVAGLSDAKWYDVVPGGLIPALVNRYVQWKATLSTTDGTKTPVVDDITVYWNPYPNAPTLTAPKDNDWISNSTPIFKWIFNDPYPGNSQEGFRVVIDDVNTFTGINYDSGIQDSTTSQWQVPYTIPDGTWYWKCCTKNNYGLWGDTSTFSMFWIDTTPPDIPVMKAEPEVTAGDENEVSWYAASDGYGRGGVEYYVQCSSDSGFAWETAHSDGWITGTSWNFRGLSDGVTYYYRVRAQDALGNQSKYSVPVWSRQDNPIITGYYASPDPFSPNADRTEDTTTIYYSLSSSCTITIGVYDSKDNLKKRLVDGKSRSVGANSEIWDGTDENGRIVSNGTYTYKITAVDGMGNREERQGTVTVENLVSIVSTKPENNGYLVIWRDKEEEIKITFNRHMSSTTMTLENIIIKDEDGLRMDNVNIVYVSSMTTITPLETEEMKYCTRYTVKVSTGVTDYLGIPLTKATSFSFTTLIPGSETGKVRVEHKGGVVKIDNPSETFPGGSKGWYINLVKTDIRSLDKYVEGTGRRLICYGVDYSDNPRDIDRLDRPVTISIPYLADTENKKNLRLYFYNKEIDRWELVKGSGDTGPDDNNYYVTGEVTRTNTEYCVRGFAAGGVIENYCNYPNPFKAGKQYTTIIYDLEEDAKVTISIYDLLGQLVRRIEIPKGTPERGEQGTNKVPWNGKNERGRVVANGGYYCVVEADTETGKHMKKARKIMVIK